MIRKILREALYRYHLRQVYGPPHPPLHAWWALRDIWKTVKEHGSR